MSHAIASRNRSSSEASLRRQVGLFTALGDATRLSLVSRLSHGEAMSITRLSEGRSTTRQSITKHLRVLKRAGLVRSVRAGRENRFALEPEGLRLAEHSLQRIAQQWDEALGRLKRMIEDHAEEPIA